jgi:hypothetical protein
MTTTAEQSTTRTSLKNKRVSCVVDAPTHVLSGPHQFQPGDLGVVTREDFSIADDPGLVTRFGSTKVAVVRFDVDGKGPFYVAVRKEDLRVVEI